LISLLIRFEKWLEAGMERLFGPRESVQPVEIARRMVRAMEEQRRISVRHIYVPNVFAVHLSPDDMAGLESITHTLSEDLANHVRAAARRQSFAFIGPIEVSFIKDEAVKKGEVKIDARFLEGEVVSAPAEAEAGAGVGTGVAEAERVPDIGETRLYRAEQLTGTRPFWQVEVSKGPDSGASFTIQLPASIGRRPDCDVQLHDQKVSRLHARLELSDQGVVVVDVGSMNGTKVNGVAIKKEIVRPGDIIEMGSTVLSIRPVGRE